MSCILLSDRERPTGEYALREGGRTGYLRCVADRGRMWGIESEVLKNLLVDGRLSPLERRNATTWTFSCPVNMWTWVQFKGRVQFHDPVHGSHTRHSFILPLRNPDDWQSSRSRKLLTSCLAKKRTSGACAAVQLDAFLDKAVTSLRNSWKRRSSHLFRGSEKIAMGLHNSCLVLNPGNSQRSLKPNSYCSTS